MTKPEISVVIPLLDEEDSLEELCNWISRVMQSHGFTYEILLIDDGSEDGSWAKIKELKHTVPKIKGYRFLRNYGKSAALNTAFKLATGNVIITMDADLQDSPDEIPELYRKIKEEKYHIVSGWKKKRHDPLGKRLPSKFYNGVTRWISGIKLHDFNCGLKAYDSQVTKRLELYGDMHRYIPVIAKWNGFKKITEQVVQHQPRKHGVSKFGASRFVTGFLDLMSITFVYKFKQRPMHFFGTLGVLAFIFGFITTVTIISIKLYEQFNHLPTRDVVNYPAFFLALVALIVGMQLFLAGFLAELITQSSSSNEDHKILERVE